ncbi:MAG: metallophosphoesterase, partial [Pseudomonadota bacterium]
DLVDRGPDSAGVVDLLSRLAASDARTVVLRGNHDHIFLEYLQTPWDILKAENGHKFYLSGNIGGRETLQSYGLRHRRAWALHAAAQDTVPARHQEFLAGLPFTYSAGECLFVHAGIRPHVPIPAQDPNDLIWIRDEFLWDSTDHGPLVVHGHTPTKTVVHMGNRLGIDTGAAFGGPLSAVAIEGREAFLLGPAGRTAVV